MQEDPGAPFPHSQSEIMPSSSSGSTGKSPHGPSSSRPSHGLTFALSNRWDLLPASMAVFKVHLWGTQADCSDKPRHGAVCVPRLPGTLAGVGDERSVLLAGRMKLPCGFFLLWLGLAGSLAQSDPSPKGEESYSDWGLRHLRGSFESVNSYVDSFMELLGGKNGVCQYRCRYGKAPMPRPGYKPQEPNGCGSYFLGIKVPGSMDLGIPAMTKCCNQLDVCYDTCGANKYRCDAKFRWCLHSICSDLKRSLGFVSNVEAACDSLADTVFNTVWTLGCRPFMNSQRAACICAEEEKEEL
ncbi:group XIIB secretory phospholipase A2-like protein isoform X1 [Peromyscus californicus insignis]|nr:group XIIB secretory phospholipase A2-like protein isoform X1 [Peromyscus californicus insignis]